MGFGIKSITQAVQQVAAPVVEVAKPVAAPVASTVTSAVQDAGRIAGNANDNILNVMVAGQGSKIDAYTGGAFSSLQNAERTPSNLLQGKSIQSNLQDSARVGATVAAGVYGGPAGALTVNQQFASGKGTLQALAGSASGFAGGGFFGNFLDKLAAPKMPTSSSSGDNFDWGSLFDTSGDSGMAMPASDNMILYAGIGVGAILLIVLIKGKT